MANPAPPIDPALVAWLNEIIPNRSPLLGESHPDLMFRGGMRKVVEILQAELKRQEEKATHVHLDAKTQEA